MSNMKKKYCWMIGIIFVFLVFLIILSNYIYYPAVNPTLAGCWEKNYVNISYIDLGGYHLYNCWEGCMPREACTYLYAEKNGISKKLMKISNFSALVKNIGGENGAIEFVRELGFFSDFSCFEIEENNYYLNKFNLTVTFKEIEIKKEGNNFVIERHLGCFGNPDKIIRSLETVSETGDYNLTTKELIYEGEWLFMRGR